MNYPDRRLHESFGGRTPKAVAATPDQLVSPETRQRDLRFIMEQGGRVTKGFAMMEQITPGASPFLGNEQGYAFFYSHNDGTKCIAVLKPDFSLVRTIYNDATGMEVDPKHGPEVALDQFIATDKLGNGIDRVVNGCKDPRKLKGVADFLDFLDISEILNRPGGPEALQEALARLKADERALKAEEPAGAADLLKGAEFARQRANAHHLISSLFRSNAAVANASLNEAIGQLSNLQPARFDEAQLRQGFGTLPSRSFPTNQNKRWDHVGFLQVGSERMALCCDFDPGTQTLKEYTLVYVDARTQ